jgi:hypothetical protein
VTLLPFRVTTLQRPAFGGCVYHFATSAIDWPELRPCIGLRRCLCHTPRADMAHCRNSSRAQPAIQGPNKVLAGRIGYRRNLASLRRSRRPGETVSSLPRVCIPTAASIDCLDGPVLISGIACSRFGLSDDHASLGQRYRGRIPPYPCKSSRSAPAFHPFGMACPNDSPGLRAFTCRLLPDRPYRIERCPASPSPISDWSGWAVKLYRLLSWPARCP